MMAPLFPWAKGCRLGIGEEGISDRVMSVYTVFVATTFNLVVTVRVAGQFTEGTGVANREHIDTKPILEGTTEFLIMKVEAREGTILGQSPA